MNPISPNLINATSQYPVRQVSEGDFCFESDFGVSYKIGFVEDYSIWETGAYHFMTILSLFRSPILYTISVSRSQQWLKAAFFLYIKGLWLR